MPKYRIEMDGRVFEVEGARPPTEQEMRSLVGGRSDAPKSEPVSAQAEPKSVGGFIENLGTSGAQFATDTVQGIGAALKFAARGIGRAQTAMFSPTEARRLAEDARGVLSSAPQTVPAIAKAVARAANARYIGVGSGKGFGGAALDTLYEDPVGALADVSSLTGVGAVAAGTRAPKLAKTLATVERYTNPVSVVAPVARGVQTVADKAGDLAITATVRPNPAVKKLAGNGKPATNQEIAAHIKKTGAVTAEGAERRLKRTQVAVDQKVADLNDDPQAFLGSILEPDKDIAPNVQAKMKDELLELSDIGENEAKFRGKVDKRVSRLSRVAPMDVAEALKAKRKAQQRAYDRPQGKSFESALDKAVAQAFKEAIESKVPGIDDLHVAERSQLIAKNALATADERSSGLSRMLAVPTLGTSLILDSPLAGAAVGIGLDRFGRTVGKAGGRTPEELLRAALIAALAARTEEQ